MENVNQVTPPASDIPMDEFETRPKGVPIKSKNILGSIKIIGIVVGGLIIVVIGISLILTMPKGSSNITPKPTAFSATVSPSARPNVQYPQEYQELSTQINAYEKGTTNIPERRNRLEDPQIDTRVSF
jgi:hypothetical protein